MVDIKAAFMKGDYPTTERIARQFVATPSENITSMHEANYFLGMSLLRQQKLNLAVKHFKKLIKSEPNEDILDKAYVGLFDAYYQDSNYKKAAKTIRRLINISPRSHYSSLIYLKAARVNLKLSDWKQARYYLNEIIDRFPNSLEYHPAKQLLEERQYFAVQVGAFVDRSRAEQVTQALLQAGEYAYIVETVDRDQTKFYRVRVGQQTVLRKAERLASKLSKLGYPTRIYP